MYAIDELRDRFPWPTEKPDAPSVSWGWGVDGSDFLTGRVPTTSGVVLEVGSLLGGSARFWAETCPGAHVVCVDPWIDVTDRAQRPFLDHVPELAEFVVGRPDGLFEVFLSSNWHLRDRLTPVRGFSPDRLVDVFAAGVRPDVIYVDGSHVYEDVIADVIVARTLFPEALICGDDWNWPGVQRAVSYIADNRGDVIQHQGNTWLLETDPDSAPDRRPARSAVAVGADGGIGVVRTARRLAERLKPES